MLKYVENVAESMLFWEAEKVFSYHRKQLQKGSEANVNTQPRAFYKLITL